jgi:hypothetical protein
MATNSRCTDRGSCGGTAAVARLWTRERARGADRAASQTVVVWSGHGKQGKEGMSRRGGRKKGRYYGEQHGEQCQGRQCQGREEA